MLADVGICAVGTLIGAMAVAGRARELLLPLLFLPLAIPIVVGGVGASAQGGASTSASSASTTRSSRCSRGPPSSTSSPRPELAGRRSTIPLREGRGLIAFPLPALVVLSMGLFAAAIALIFFYAPTDPNQGLSQRIFYFHVPIALTAYASFGWGAWKALRYLWKRDERADLESYVAIHQGVIFGSLTLITGSIWARISWGVWWVWGDDQLVLFLVLFLFYCAYFMLRYSVEPGPRARTCAPSTRSSASC